MPAPTLRGPGTTGVQSGAGPNTVALTTPTGTVAGDTVIAAQALNFVALTDLVAPTGDITDWVLIAQISGEDTYLKVWLGHAPAGGANTVNLTNATGSSNYGAILPYQGDVDVDGTPTTFGTATDTSSHALPSITTLTEAATELVGVWTGIGFTGTPHSITVPASMSGTQLTSVDSSGFQVLAVGRETLSSSAATGTRTATSNNNFEDGWAGIMFALTATAPAQTVTPTTIPAPAAPGQPTVTSGLQIAPTTIPAPAAPGGPTVVPGEVVITPTTIDPPAPPGEPTLTQIVAPTTIPAPPAPGEPTVGQGVRPPLRVDFWALADDGTILCPLPQPVSWDLSLIPGEVGAVRLRYPVDGLNFAELDARVNRFRDLHIHIRTDGTVLNALGAILQAREADEVAEAGIVTFTGSFLTVRLEEAPLPYNVADEKGETVFAAANAGQIMGGVLTATQAGGFATGLSWTFTGVVDSRGTPWPAAGYLSPTFPPGKNMLQIAQQLRDWGLIEFEVTTDLEVRVYVPETIGVDHTTKDPPIVLRRGRDLLESPRRTDVRSSATDLLVAGKDGVYVSLFDATARARRGRRVGAYVSEGNLADTASATAYGTVDLARRVFGLDELTHELTFDQNHPTPLRELYPADWVYSDGTGGGFTEVDRERIVQLTISQGRDEDRYSGGVVLRDLISDREVSLQRQIDRLTNSSIVIGTSQPPPTEPDGIAPAAPTALVVSSLAYNDGANEPTRAVVTVGYTPPTLNTDGSPLTDLGGFRARLRYIGLIQTGIGEPGEVIPNDGNGSWTRSEDVAAGVTSIAMSGVDAEAAIEMQVQAFDTEDPPNDGPWSIGSLHTTQGDATAPPAPSAPVVSDWFGTLAITWDGLDYAGADMRVAAPDLKHVEVHVSQTSAFTPSAATLSAVITGATTWNVTDLLIGATWFARLVAVDRADNASAPSVQGSAVPRGITYPDMGPDAIDSAQIRDLAVLTAHVGLAQIVDANINNLNVGKLVAGTLSAQVLLAGNIHTALSGQRMVIDGTGWRAYNSSSVLFAELNIPSASMLVTGEFRTGLSGERVHMLMDGTMRFYPSAGSNYSLLANNGNELYLRGPTNGSGQSGQSFYWSSGVGLAFGTYPAGLNSRLSVGDRLISQQGVLLVNVLDGRFSQLDSQGHRVLWKATNSSGNDIGNSYLHLSLSLNSNQPWLFGATTNTGLQLNDAVNVVANDGSYKGIRSSNFELNSAIARKAGIAPARFGEQRHLTSLQVAQAARAQRWYYRSDLQPRAARPDIMLRRLADDGTEVDWKPAEWAHPQRPAPLHIGPMADDLLAVAPELVMHTCDGEPTLDVAMIAGMAWDMGTGNGDDIAAIRRELAELREHLDPPPMIVDGQVA